MLRVRHRPSACGELRTFDQAGVDRIVTERLRRQTDNHERQLEELVAAHTEQTRELEAQLVETNARLTETASRAQEAAIGEAVARSAFDRGIRDVDAAV